MSCANAAGHSVVIGSTRVPLRWRAFIATVVAIQDAFQEALDMRRAAHKEYRLNDE